MEIKDWGDIRYFRPDEFDDPEVPGSWRYMAIETVRLLDALRKGTGWPVITHNRFGLRGCVCVRRDGHSGDSRHYADHPDGCSAVDFHFDTTADARLQALKVMSSGFRGVGVYYDWIWGGKQLKAGFHADLRSTPQYWRCESGKYFYLLK